VSIPDTLAWAVNFTNDNGFAVIAADTRVSNSTLAISASGNIPPVFDSLDNEGLQMFLALTEPYLINEIAESEILFDSLIETGALTLPDTGNSVSVPVEYYFKRIGEPILTPLDTLEYYQRNPMIPTEWERFAPFNQFVVCDNPNCTESLAAHGVGCKSVAWAHILAMYGHPQPYEIVQSVTIPVPSQTPGFSYPPVSMTATWDVLNQYSGAGNRPGSYYQWLNRMLYAPEDVKVAAAMTLRAVGEAMQWSYCDGNSESDTDPNDFLDWFRDLGYIVPDDMDYSVSPVSSSIRNGRPVVISGEIIILRTDGKDYYHVWNVDGMIESEIAYECRQRYGLFHVDNPDVILDEIEVYWETTKTETLHHYNWGGTGGGNGYYNAGVFGAGTMVANSDGTPTTGNGNYTPFNIVTDIRRQTENTQPVEGVGPVDRF
jgi:hypothetical protein